MEYRIVKTHIEGLDEIIGGGFTRPGLVYIVGHPGTGKTMLALNYAYNRAIHYGEKTKYLTLSEPKDLLISRLRRLKFERIDEFIEKYLSIDEALPLSEYSVVVSVVTNVLEDLASGEFSNLVIDSISSLIRGLEPREIQSTLAMLFKEVVGKDMTTIIIGEIPLFGEIKLSGIEEFIADIVIRLDYVDRDGERLAVRLTPIKMRIGAIDRKYTELAIDDYGVHIIGKLSS